MVVIASDILYVLSGGTSNNDPDLSLGGDPSSIAISGKRLFDNVSEDEAVTGVEDYRCFYVFNNNGEDTLYNVETWLVAVEGGADAQIGFNLQNEVQEISITGSFNSGSFSLNVTPSTVNSDPIEVEVDLDMDPDVFAANLEAALNTVFDSVSVTATSIIDGSYEQIIFQVEWDDEETYRYQELLVVSDNSLSGSPSISVSKVLNGSPINTIADEIDFETTIPGGISFDETDEDNVIALGDLRPLDGFPVWIRRTVAPNADAFENDGFAFRFRGSPIVS